MEGITGYFFVWGPTLLMVALFSTVAVRRIRASRRRREARQARQSQSSVGGVTMRRQDRHLTDPAEIHRIIRSGTVCRVALAVANEPYIVSLSYGALASGGGSSGVGEIALYFHCASSGRKLDMIRENPRACFTIDGHTEITEAERPCDWSINYSSVVGYGTITELSDLAHKRRGLDVIMRQHGATGELDYPENMITRTTILKLDVESITAKSNKNRQEADDHEIP